MINEGKSQNNNAQGDNGHQMIGWNAEEIGNLIEIGRQNEQTGRIAENQRQAEEFKAQQKNQGRAEEDRGCDQRQTNGHRDPPGSRAGHARRFFNRGIQTAQRR